MRYAIIPLIISAVLHLLGFALADFASDSLFLLFPAGLYCVLSLLLLRGVIAAGWLTLVCMIGGVAGTLIEFTGPLIAPAPILIAIILADASTAALLIRGLWLARKSRSAV